MVNSKIMLPIDQTGCPDWIFMEDYIREKEQKVLIPTIDKLCKRLIDSEIIGWRYNLRTTQWKEFYFTDVFEDIQRGKRLKKGDHQEGDMPYISSTSLNNGVLCFVQPQKKLIQKGNCIAFIRNGEGSMGYAVYKSEDFIATSDMTLGYNPNLNR